MHNFIYFLEALLSGIFLGFIIAIPVGPASIESVKRTVSKSFKEGFTVSLGAVSADMAYLLIINCGLSNLLAKNKTTDAFFWIISGSILFFIGYKSLNDSKNILPKDKNKYEQIMSKLSAMPFLSGFAITFTNPLTPSLWLFMSGTWIKAWQFNSICYYTFIFSIIAGMIAWFFLLNYLALRGMKVLTPSISNKTSVLLIILILTVGIAFILVGLVKLII